MQNSYYSSLIKCITKFPLNWSVIVNVIFLNFSQSHACMHFCFWLCYLYTHSINVLSESIVLLPANIHSIEYDLLEFHLSDPLMK